MWTVPLPLTKRSKCFIANPFLTKISLQASFSNLGLLIVHLNANFAAKAYFLVFLHLSNIFFLQLMDAFYILGENCSWFCFIFFFVIFFSFSSSSWHSWELEGGEGLVHMWYVRVFPLNAVSNLHYLRMYEHAFTL